ncbi:MAG: DUF2220 family protein [Lachnospiraceae bacterium]|nr:DUF2220 family protein [Lachnospiraceae bacterium]
MHTRLTKYQAKLLSELIELYEKSKTYEGTNQVTQSFSRLPSQIFTEYDSDYTDYDLVQDFENQMKELEEEDLICIEWKNGVIKKLFANTGAWDRYNKILKRTDKNVRINEEILFYQNCLGFHEWLDTFCLEQIKRLESGKKAAYDIVDTKVIINLIKTILMNKEELLERELSISFFSDSKKFEKSYRSKVCTWLRKYGDFESLLEGIDDKREIEQIILGEFNISANPSYVYFKGNAAIIFDNGNIIRTEKDFPIALSSVALEHVSDISIGAEAVMTVENLTSFNRVKDEKYFYIFLSGYHNTVKQKMLVNIFRHNEGLKWFHFGDMDPDGLYIVEHLKKGTGIPFETYHMSVSDLKRYRKFSKPLTKNDEAKAKSLLENGKYTELLQYMLSEGCKLEQEIVSLELSK